MIFAIKSLGAEGIHKLVAEIIPGIQDVDADTVLTIFNMGLYVVVLMAIASIPSVFVSGVIGAWIGEKIRLQFSHTSPDDGFMKIDNRVPPKPLIDTSITGNSPVRFRAQNTAEEPATTEKQPAKMTILHKLKT